MTDTIDLTSSEVAAGGSGLERPSLEQLAVQLMDRARDEGVSLVGPGGLLAGLTKTVLESALDGGADRASGLRPVRPGGAPLGELPQRDPEEDGADRDRPDRAGGAPRPGRDLRAGDRPQAAPAAERGGRTGVFAVGQGADARGDLRASGRDLRGAGVEGDDHPDHRPGARGHERVAEPAAGPRSTRSSSSTRST